MQKMRNKIYPQKITHKRKGRTFVRPFFSKHRPDPSAFSAPISNFLRVLILFPQKIQKQETRLCKKARPQNRPQNPLPAFFTKILQNLKKSVIILQNTREKRSGTKEENNMPLVNAKCTNCGGTLQVDNAKEAAVCPFCNGFKSISLFWKCKKCGIQYIREK